MLFWCVIYGLPADGDTVVFMGPAAHEVKSWTRSPNSPRDNPQHWEVLKWGIVVVFPKINKNYIIISV